MMSPAVQSGPTVALVGSSGGHLLHLLQLKPWYSRFRRVWATFDTPDAAYSLAGERVYWVHHPTTRHIPNMLKNFLVAIRLLRAERPSLIVSTGAGSAIPFFVLGKLLGSRLVWIEVIDRIESPSLTGKLLGWLADVVVVHWKSQEGFWKRAHVLGPLF